MADARDLFVVFLAELDLLEVGNDASWVGSRVSQRLKFRRRRSLTFGDALGDLDVTSVGAPCNEDLGLSSAELLGNLLDDLVLRQ